MCVDPRVIACLAHGSTRTRHEMSEETLRELARREINESLFLSNFCMHRIGLSFENKKSFWPYVLQKILFALSFIGICYHVFSEIAYISITLINSPRVEDVVPLFHTFGYGLLSIAKVLAIWYKLDVFTQLLTELVDIWPVQPLDQISLKIKNKSLSGLRTAHRWYFACNVAGVWFYNLTPLGIYFYNLWQHKQAEVGFVWVSWYPFDKEHPVAHVFVYIFEMFAGQTCVWIMVCSDLLFTAMASHISMLLRILQLRLNTLGITSDDNYQNLIDSVKLHQRLIRYCKDLEETFSLVNLVNIVLSSVNICCVLFVIVLLEPLMAVSNKLFLMSALIQMGVICWYADDIFHANANVGMAAYCSRWYRTEPRCRKALLFLIIRSQKPIAFTAMGFKNLSLATYSSMLTTSYSYFALLHTMYRNNSYN